MNSSDDRPAILGGVPVNPAGPPEWPPDDPAVVAALHAVAANGSWGRYHDSHCEALRDRLAALHGVPHVHLCSSGTAAVELALRGVGVGPGDEVLLAAYDFKGNIADVLALGATPVLIDVRPDDAQIDLARLEAAASDRTKAVLVSHLHGAAVDMPRLREVADARGWAVAEDACQTPGSPIHGRVAGTWGDAGVLSFGGSKLLTAGRGGAVVTSGDDVMQRIKLFTARGNDLSPLSELQAAVLLPQLDRLADRNATRAASAAALLGLLRDQPGLRPLASGGCRPSGHTGDTHRQGKVVPRSLSHSPGLYKLGFWYDHAACAGLPRDLFAAALRAEGIAMWPGFRALHRTHSRRRFRTVGDLPHAAEADADSLVLHHPVLLEGPEALRDVAAAVRKVRAFAEEIAARAPAALPFELG